MYLRKKRLKYDTFTVRKKKLGVMRAQSIGHSDFWIVIKSNGVQRHDNTSYIWGCYHMITHPTIYIRRGTTSTVYFMYKSRTNKTGSTSGDTRRSRRQRSMNQNSYKRLLYQVLCVLSFPCEHMTSMCSKSRVLSKLVWCTDKHFTCYHDIFIEQNQYAGDLSF